MPKVDYAVIEERDFSPVENGIYPARLTKWDLVEAKEPGKFPYYNCEYTASEEAGIGNRKFWNILSLSPQSLWAFKKTMIALGASPADMEPGSDVDTDEVIASCLEAPCRLQVVQEKYHSNKTGQEEVRSSIAEVLPSELPF